jgi:ubiquinone/menaquinone biosynthesis C-methylase UbiE
VYASAATASELQREEESENLQKFGVSQYWKTGLAPHHLRPFMDRILEPEVMDGPDEALVYDAMDHAAANQAFVEALLTNGLQEGAWLDLGTGTAQIPLELCLRHPMFRGRIVAIDLSESMLDVARCHLEVARLMDRVRLNRADAKALPFEDAQFDVVFSNSIVHHVAEPETVLSEGARVVRPGGLLFFRDLLRPATVADVEQLVTRYAGQESPVAQQLFRASLHAALTLEEVRALVERIGFQADSVYASSDRHWTWRARADSV